jgi:hypothetical protein
MDKWRQYMADNEDNLSIEDVDDKVWQNIYKAAVPKRKVFITSVNMAFSGLIKKFKIKKEEDNNTWRNSKVRLAYALIFFTLIIVSCTYKVKSYAKHGDMITFALAKTSNLLSNQAPANSLLHSFSRIARPSDSSSFLFIKFIRQNNQEAKKLFENLKEVEGVSDLNITPIVFEYKESLFSSFLHKALEIKIKEAKPDNKQIKNKIKEVLKDKDMGSVDIQVDDYSQDVWFSTKTLYLENLPQTPKDSLTIKKDITDNVKGKSKTDTTHKPILGSRKFNTDIKLMTELITALKKTGLIDTRKPYKLEVKDGELYIDGKKQSKEVRDKFKKYLKSDNYTITNDGDGPPSNHNEVKDRTQTGLEHPGTNIQMFDGSQYLKELKLMNQLIIGLEKEGLLDSKKPYWVNIKEGELYINGKKQPKEVSDKFRQFFQSDNYGFQKS